MGLIYTKKKDDTKDKRTVQAEDFMKRLTEHKVLDDSPQELPRTEILKD